VYRWVPPNHFCHLSKSEITIPNLLLNAGYQTGHFGKFHLSYYNEKRIGKSNGFSDFEYGGEIVDQPSMQDYGYQYSFSNGNVARPNHRNPLNFFLNGKAMGEMKGFSAQLVADQFVQWMKVHRDPAKPFFATIWFHEPHGPIQSDPEYLRCYEDFDIDPSYQQYLANITQIDGAVGVIIDILKKEGAYNDTLLWYTSDNGPESSYLEHMQGAHGLGSFNKTDHPYDRSRYRGSSGGLSGRKRNSHEGGIRVPGIISWPNGFKNAKVKPGRLSAEPIIGTDFFPTILDVAGLPFPSNITLDGQSILPLLEGRSLDRKKPLYWRNTAHQFKVALRDGDWKIMSDSLRHEFVLYNIIMDHRETTDLSKHYPDVFEKMKKCLIEYDKEVLREGKQWWKNDMSPFMEFPMPKVE
jgi:arylsulfatase A-like enzyme